MSSPSTRASRRRHALRAARAVTLSLALGGCGMVHTPPPEGDSGPPLGDSGPPIADAGVDAGPIDCSSPDWWDSQECCESSGGFWDPDFGCAVPGPFLPPDLPA